MWRLDSIVGTGSFDYRCDSVAFSTSMNMIESWKSHDYVYKVCSDKGECKELSLIDFAKFVRDVGVYGQSERKVKGQKFRYYFVPTFSEEGLEAFKLITFSQRVIKELFLSNSPIEVREKYEKVNKENYNSSMFDFRNNGLAINTDNSDYLYLHSNYMEHRWLKDDSRCPYFVCESITEEEARFKSNIADAVIRHPSHVLWLSDDTFCITRKSFNYLSDCDRLNKIETLGDFVFLYKYDRKLLKYCLVCNDMDG